MTSTAAPSAGCTARGTGTSTGACSVGFIRHTHTFVFPIIQRPPKQTKHRISAVAHLPDGRLLSGGGDGKLCLWPRAPSSIPSATCQDLDGHASAVSQLAAVPGSRLAFSAAYDGTVRACFEGLWP